MKILLRPTGLTIQEVEYPTVEVDLDDFPETKALDPLDAAAWLTEQISLNTNETGMFQGQEGPLRALYDRIQAQAPLTPQVVSSRALELSLEEQEVRARKTD